MSNLPLYDLFMELNERAGRNRLGMDNYFLLLDLIQREPGWASSLDNIAFACELLWMKDERRRPAFATAFAKRRAALQAVLETMATENQKSGQPETVGEPTGEYESKPASDQGPANAPAPGATNADSRTSQGTKETTRTADNGAGSLQLRTGAGQGTGSDTSGSLPGNPDLLPPSKSFLLNNEYFPVPGRALLQNWRSLVSKQESTPGQEVDVSKTIRTTARRGEFRDLEYKREANNRLSLFIFIDMANTMVAYTEFGKELGRSAEDSLAHGRVQPYFFSDYPLPDPDPANGFLLMNEEQTESYTTRNLFRSLDKRNIVALVYSDAGALSGPEDPNPLGVPPITGFLNYLIRHTAYAAWLNPAPESRWKNTNAADIIGRFPEIPMYEAGRTGMLQAINTLKGKSSSKSLPDHATV